MKRILYGISGIGTGHTYRQLPILRHLARRYRIALFVYGESERICRAEFRSNRNVTIIHVDIPFWSGKPGGLDFKAAAHHPENQHKRFFLANCVALERAQRAVGTPDLVITDYEPLSAQYAYAHGAPLVTFDQQSKYLCGTFPARLGNQGFGDEIMRLRMFFPIARARIACSFFRVERRAGSPRVEIFPPPLRDEIAGLRRAPGRRQRTVIVYISSQREFVQPARDWIATLASQPGTQFLVFLKEALGNGIRVPPNVAIMPHGDPRFLDALRTCSGIIATAGHMLLSEAMHHAIPVYAIPLAVYEQQMNARVIGKNGFGITRPRLTREGLAAFVHRLDAYNAAIKRDRTALLRSAGQKRIIARIERILEA